MGTREPVKEPLPIAGGSAYQELLDKVDGFVGWLFYPACLFVLVAWEWARYFGIVPLTPWLVTILFLISAFVVWWRWKWVRPELHNLRLGVKGERRVGEALEGLRTLGYRVFHDVSGDGDYNIDHVLVGPGGVFAIETKTISKPIGRRAEVAYDGNRVLVDGWEPDRDPIAQAKACGDGVRKLLEDMTGKSVSVRSAVVFPGWFVHPQPRGVDVWVLSPDALMAFVANEYPRLSDEDIALFSNRLEIHGRSS